MDIKIIVMYCIIIKNTFGLELDFEDSSKNSTATYNSTVENLESDVSTFTLYKIGRFCSVNVCDYSLQISAYVFVVGIVNNVCLMECCIICKNYGRHRK